MQRLTGIALLFCITAFSAYATGAAEIEPLAPHRAVYEINLTEPGAGGIENIAGRLVFEMTGSDCEGYVMNTRFVLNTTLSQERSILNDFQSSSWEDPSQNAFRFLSKDFVDNELTEEINGNAESKNGEIEVTLTLPEEKTFDISPDAHFPVMHIKKMLEAAVAGEQVFQAELYDGTDGGEKIYGTTAIIGAPFSLDDLGDFSTPTDEKLAGVRRWPVTMSYFDDTSAQADEGLPIYQMAFQIYENGVTRSLVLDYGDFKLSGDLSSIEFFKPTICD